MTPSDDQLRDEMRKIGALPESRYYKFRLSANGERSWPPGGNADSHCEEFGKCADGFLWDCVFDKVDVCDVDHKGKVELRLKTHGCNNCEPIGVGPIEYSWYSQPHTGDGKPDCDSGKWKMESDFSTITIQPDKDYKLGDKIWLKQEAVCSEYAGQKNKTICSVFKVEMVPCDEDGNPIDPCKKDDDCPGSQCCGDDGQCSKKNCPDEPEPTPEPEKEKRCQTKK